MVNRKQALVLANIATLLLGTTGLFARWISVSSVGITFGRVFLSSIVLFTFCKYKRQDIKIKSRKNTGEFLIAGILLAIHWIAFMEAVKLANVAVSTITFATFPLFLTFLEPMVFKTRLTGRNVVLAAIVVVGISITAWGSQTGSEHFMGFVVGFISAISYAFLQLFNKKFTYDGYNGTVISMYEQSIVAVMLMPTMFAMHIQPSGRDILLLLALGIFCTALAHTSLIMSMKILPAQLVGMCNSMETIYAIILAAVLLGETPTINEIIGAILVTIAVIIAQRQTEVKK